MAIWCWHAVGNPMTPVIEDNYRCCWGTGKSKFGYITCLCVDLILILICLFTTTRETGQNQMALIVILAITIPITILGFLPLMTLKPMHMQIYWILYVMQMFATVLVIGILILIFFVLPENTFSKDHHMDVPKTVGGILAICLLAALVLAYVFWRGSVTYSYYRYIRDRQLAIEHQGSNLAHAADNLAHDIEK
ncbi:unnamed protein product, partial [Mesorhabditis spiculigera]